MSNIDQELRVKRAHMTLMKNRATALYAGVMLMGTSSVDDGDFTAFTDGVNKKYCKKFLETHIKTESELRGLVLHENLHVALKQPIFGREMFTENPKLANMAADFVVNDIIDNIRDMLPNSNERLVKLPDGALFDSQFHNWSMRQVYDYLKRKQDKEQDKDKDKGSGEKGEGDAGYDTSKTDAHDFSEYEEMTHEEAKKQSDKVDRALREGGMLAGRMGGKIPKVIEDLLTPKVPWNEYLREFWTSFTRGKDEFTWRKPNKRMLANDLVMPGIENETVGEVIIAIDTSGSIGSHEITEFATEIVSLCNICTPDKVRVLWWDTMVHGEQVFTDNYDGIASMLKPLGGGGTRVQCVSEYLIKEKVNAECVIVFTDGYVESDPQWAISAPTMWLVTQNKNWSPPVGKKVIF